MNEFDKLCKMLDDAKIPYERNDDKNNLSCFGVNREPMRRIVYGPDPDKDRVCVCSVICGYGSYGYEEGLLEMMGLLTPEEMECDSVKGWLTADDVFNRIKRHWEETNGCKEM